MPSEIVNRASNVMRELDPKLIRPFSSVVWFLEENRELANARGMEFGSLAYLEKYAVSFAKGRNKNPPKCPATVSDPMVAFILGEFWGLDDNEAESAVDHHNYAMGAENIIGNLLEHYIAEELEPHGWAWCSGSLVQAVDFVHRDAFGKWTALQVKNRDNSENSSSKAIRDGKDIRHWFRTFSRKTGTNWANFPRVVDQELSEEGFQHFVSRYLRQLR